MIAQWARSPTPIGDQPHTHAYTVWVLTCTHADELQQFTLIWTLKWTRAALVLVSQPPSTCTLLWETCQLTALALRDSFTKQDANQEVQLRFHWKSQQSPDWAVPPALLVNEGSFHFHSCWRAETLPQAFQMSVATLEEALSTVLIFLNKPLFLREPETDHFLSGISLPHTFFFFKQKLTSSKIKTVSCKCLSKMTDWIKTNKQTAFMNQKAPMHTCSMKFFRFIRCLPANISHQGSLMLLLYKTFIKFLFTKQHVHHIKVDSRLIKQRTGSELTFHSEGSDMSGEESKVK